LGGELPGKRLEATTNFGAAAQRLVARGAQHPEPLQSLCELAEYQAHASAAILRHLNPEAAKALGDPPKAPSGQWAIDAALIDLHTPWVRAEVFPPSEPDDDSEPGDIAQAAAAFSGTLPRPSLDLVLG
jgi:hypothetical protein